MKKLGILLVLAIGLFSPTADATEKHPYKTISADELAEMQKNGTKLVIIDSRGGKYFDGEVIKGAVHLAVTDTDVDNLAKTVPAKDSNIVFYCQNTACPASELSAYKAAAAGYTNLYKYPGGIEEWKQKGLPTAKIN